MICLKNFFCSDRKFYRDFIQMFLLLAVQNIIVYSVNVADNIMLGAYSQTALSGAAAVNQIQYVLQQFTVMGLGEGIVILAGQYWGQNKTENVQQIVGIALLCGLIAGGMLTLCAFAFPEFLVGIFSDDKAIQGQSMAYLKIIRWTYLVFIVTNILFAVLRSMKMVKIAFQVSIVTLFVNVGINYVLIYGRFGMPELGIRGAAVGTLIARCIELGIVLTYCRKKEMPIKFHGNAVFCFERRLFLDYLRVSVPCIVSALLFSCAVAIQTAIFGHLDSDAIAASSAAGTLFQFCKMLPSSVAATASVWISGLVGSSGKEEIKRYVHTMQTLFFMIGLVICYMIITIRVPFLHLYEMTPQAKDFAMQMLGILAVISIGMAYQMPCQIGIIRGGGDTKYSMYSDILYSWVFTVPLGLLSAFVWKLPFPGVVFCLNCDQILKCITVGIKTNGYTWIKKLTV